MEVRKGAKIRNRYNQVPHLTQDTNEKVTNSQLYTTSESQEVSPFPAGDHKAQINRRTQRHNNLTNGMGQGVRTPPPLKNHKWLQVSLNIWHDLVQLLPIFCEIRC